MPITKAAQKALRQSKKRRITNIVRKEALKKVIKEFRGLLGEKKTEEAKKMLAGVYKVLDKSTKTNIIKANTASRIKARLTRGLNKLAAK